jgi:hypothetical protein
VIPPRPGTSGSSAGDGGGLHADRSVTLKLDEFAWETLEAESTSHGVRIEELISFAVLYYLADLDSGRIARRITRSPYPDAS